MSVEQIEVLMNEQSGISVICQDCDATLFETPSQKHEDLLNADLSVMRHLDCFPNHRVLVFKQVYPQ